MFIINPKRYEGRFVAVAKERHAKGLKTGMVWIDTNSDEKLSCHKCETRFDKPALDAARDGTTYKNSTNERSSA